MNRLQRCRYRYRKELERMVHKSGQASTTGKFQRGEPHESSQKKTVSEETAMDSSSGTITLDESIAGEQISVERKDNDSDGGERKEACRGARGVVATRVQLSRGFRSGPVDQPVEEYPESGARSLNGVNRYHERNVTKDSQSFVGSSRPADGSGGSVGP
ncbi:2328_t:CDS:2 [Acaulospora colombiana]|uniref:2328_t:CDS:1 n=1 Tax=Acaulospora colombiana TaxID=27376 RepID=A0ACA9Q6A2_9GLOM|nr:2328_t:CDS:2 [Acaulospora colombiana]